MQTDSYNIQRFLALSELYFRLTSEKSDDINNREFEEFIEAINDCSQPQMSPGQYLS